MKRCLAILCMLCLLLCSVPMGARAESAATKIDSYVTVNGNGDCYVSLTVQLHLEAAVDNLTFPLPPNATNITMNQSSVRTYKTSSAIEVDVGKATSGMIGDFTVRFDYTIPGAVTVNEYKMLQLDLPMLSGFEFPVEQMAFVITLPADIVYMPNFSSTYRQASVASDMIFEVDKQMITGNTTQPLNDHESMAMTLVVTQEMFPGVSTYVRNGDPEIYPMIGCAVLALLYWLLFLRTWPLIRRRSVSAPEGMTAGEVGCHLTLAGGDLTMMSFHWAQLGYVLIQVDGNRVWLHKRMDMGNERSPFEVKVFNMLFADKKYVDATSFQYAKLSRKVFAMIPGERNLLKSNSGNVKVFRGLLCGSQIFCGICVAMNMSKVMAIQILLAVILAAFGAISAWQIHEIAYRTHLRGKTRVYIGLVCILIWIVLGILCGQWIIPLCCTLGQFFFGYFAAYGGRRNELGRHDAGQILGLRHYLKHISKEDISRLMKTDPYYFFNMAPFALSLGMIRPFGRNFGSRKIDHCPYLIVKNQGKRTADEWAEIIAATADMIDEKYRRMEIEKWTAVRFR